MYEQPMVGGGGAGDNTPVWFYVDGVLPQGPFTHAEILKKFEAGEITAATTVYRNGEAKWLPLSKEPAFAYYFNLAPELRKTSFWRRGWIWSALLFVLLALYPILSSIVVQKDKLEEEIKVAFVDLCNENNLALQRADVEAVKLTKEGEGCYTGEAIVENAEGEKRSIPLSVTVEGSMMKGRSYQFSIEGETDWLREHF